MSLLEEIEARDLRAVRFSFADQHGVLRGKTLAAAEVRGALERGVTITSTLLLKDSSHRTVFPAFTPGGGVGMPELQGAADVLMVPDPATFRVLPWAADTGWVLCDLQRQDGRPVPYDSRAMLKRALAKLDADFIAGLEVEFHVFRILDAKLAPADAGQPGSPPEVELLTTGYQYLTENRYDQIDPVVRILENALSQLGMPLRSFEVEFGPSQFEFTLAPLPGLQAADAMVLLRSAVKQVARRHGYHATFMCRPKLPNVMSSGWHLHQSLSRGGRNAFASETEDLSETGKQWLAGLLAHARGCCALATPTLNGYKRYRPYSLAPDRIVWGKENRGALLRVIGGPAARRRASRTASASRRRTRTSISPRRCTPAATAWRGASRCRPRPTRPPRRKPSRCRIRSAKRSPRCARTPCCARASARRSSSTTAASRKPRSRASTSR